MALATLNLGCNGIGDVGAERLAGALGQCSSLVRLSLRYNPIRTEVSRDNSEGEEDDGARRMMRMTVRMIKIEGG